MKRRHFLLNITALSITASTISKSVFAQTVTGNEPVEIIIPRAGGAVSRAPNRQICQKHSLGWTKIMRESKLEWEGLNPTLRCRDRNAHAYAVICGPDNVLNAIIDDVAKCSVVGLAAAGLAAIIASPAAATPAFWVAFKTCISGKIGDKVDLLSVNLVVEEQTTDWGAC